MVDGVGLARGEAGGCTIRNHVGVPPDAIRSSIGGV